MLAFEDLYSTQLSDTELITISISLKANFVCSYLASRIKANELYIFVASQQQSHGGLDFITFKLSSNLEVMVDRVTYAITVWPSEHNNQ